MALRDDIIDALQERRLTVAPDGERLEATRGRGISAQRADLDVAPFLRWLADRPDDSHARYVSGFANGVASVLLEPKRSQASDWEFERAAGGLLPTVEVETFAHGVEAATGGDRPLTTPFHDDLILCYHIRLDLGLRVLTQPQFDAWSATRDRVDKAARSLLFHETRNARWQGFADDSPVALIASGDDYDAARALILSDVFFSEIGQDFRFTMPSQEQLLSVGQADEASLAALEEATQRVYEEATYPLSTTVFAYQHSRPVPAEL